MRQLITILTFLTLVSACNNITSEKYKQHLSREDSMRHIQDSIAHAEMLMNQQLTEDHQLNRIDTLNVDDIDGDGRTDSAFIGPYNLYTYEVNIRFSCDIPPIIHSNGFGGLLVNVGNLDGSGTSELLYYPSWFQSNSAGIFVYRLKRNKWSVIAHGSARRDIIAEAKDESAYLKKMVKKIDNRSFMLKEHVWVDGDIVTTSRKIIIQ